MNHLYYDPQGRILQTTSAPNGFAPAEIDGLTAMEYGSLELPEHGAYIENGNVIPKPPKPDKYHQFNYTTRQWHDPRTQADMMNQVRGMRLGRLQATDWTQLPDVPTETRDKYTAYRQALRDITDQPDPKNITWPTAPK